MEGENSDNIVNWFDNGIFQYYEFDSSRVMIAKETDNVTGKCKLCPRTKRASISGRVRVSSNFVKHVRVSITCIACLLKFFIT